jgi:hypothetical protein
MARVVAEMRALQAAHSNDAYSATTKQNDSGEAMAAQSAAVNSWPSGSSEPRQDKQSFWQGRRTHSPAKAFASPGNK